LRKQLHEIGVPLRLNILPARIAREILKLHFN